MFNIGGGELLVIMLIALIVLGPQRLPDAARQIGKTMGELRRLSTGFQNEMKSALDTVKDADPRNVLATKVHSDPVEPVDRAAGTAEPSPTSVPDASAAVGARSTAATIAKTPPASSTAATVAKRAKSLKAGGSATATPAAKRTAASKRSAVTKKAAAPSTSKKPATMQRAGSKQAIPASRKGTPAGPRAAPRRTGSG